MSVGDTILKQLGGNRFIAMTGAKGFSTDGNNLCMTLTTNIAKAKYLTITLDANDTYTMKFCKRLNKNMELPVVKEYEGVYFDQLQSIYTEVTGQYTTL